MFGRRPDATLVRDIPAMRRFMPFISPRRNESLFYHRQEVDVDAALAFCEQRNEHRDPKRPITLFHVILHALARSMVERPHVNRFTKGGRLWQRNEVWLTFSAKMKMEDGAPMITVKRKIPPDVTIDEFVDGLLDSLNRGRRGEKTTSDKEVDWLLYLPPFVIRFALWLADRADDLGLLPKSMIDSDPMFTSAFVANLGSVNLDGGYHHLWEHGTCPIFLVIGKVDERAGGKRGVTLKWSYDERIEDGLYAMAALGVVKHYVENPEKLLG